jgi:hypothetical protein
VIAAGDDGDKQIVPPRRGQPDLKILPEPEIDVGRQDHGCVDWASAGGEVGEVEVVEPDVLPGLEHLGFRVTSATLAHVEALLQPGAADT